MADPLPSDEIHWGKEVNRLFPPSPLLVNPEQLLVDATTTNPKPGTSCDYFIKVPFCQRLIFPSFELTLLTATGRYWNSSLQTRYRSSRTAAQRYKAGLAYFRARIPSKSSCCRPGTWCEVSCDPEKITSKHQSNVDFVLVRCRLAAILHAALLQAVHVTTDSIPGPDDFYRSRSALDLRNGWMQPPYSEKRQYVNSAFVIHPIEIPCNLYNQENGFWKAATYISNLWSIVKKKKGMVATMEAEAAAVVESREKQKYVSTAMLLSIILTASKVLLLLP